MRKLLVVILALFCSTPLLAQDLTPMERLQMGQEAVERWGELQAGGSHYRKYLLIIETIGAVQYQQLNMANLAEVRDTIRMELTQESRQRVQAFIDSFNPANFSGPDRATARNIQSMAREMNRFLNSMNGETAYELVRRYESSDYSIRRSMVQGMNPVHLGPEIMRFAAAIVIVRIATCFGGSASGVMNHITQWQTPALRASHSDPVCIDEIVDMLKSPIFYVGFTAFIVGSRAGNAMTLQALRALDPDHGPRTQRFVRHWVPHIALAIGFMSDHLVKQLVQNPYLMRCGAEGLGNMIGNSVQNIGQAIARDRTASEDHEVRAVFAGFKGQTCRRAMASIDSDQFLKEELGVGVAGLVATAVLMANGSQLVGTVVSRGGRAAGLVGRMSQYVMAISSVTGVGGFVIGTVRMVVFLGLFEVINPYIERLYRFSIMQGTVDRLTRDFALQAGQYSPGQIPLLTEESCSRHYSGEQENGDLGLCTRLPLLASLYTFHDYSKAWRKKHILKEFNQSHHRWKTKLTSYINNYMMSLQMMSTLVRTREMYLKFEGLVRNGRHPMDIRLEDYISDVDQQRIVAMEQRIQEIIADENSGGATMYQQVLSDYQRQQEDWSFQSPFRDMELSTPERQIFELLSEIDYQKYLVEILPQGNPFQFINGENNTWPTPDELDNLVIDIMEFINPPEVERSIYVEIRTPEVSFGGSAPHLVPNTLLQQIGLPLDLAYNPYQMEMIRYYLQTPDVEYNLIGLMLFKEWAPFMFGPYQRMAERDDPEGNNYGNPQGLHPVQWPRYQRINTALEPMTPIFPWEMTYIANIWGDLANRERSQEDGQFDNVSQGLQTKSLADYVLAQLICGQNPSYRNLFGDNGGVALQFAFPHLTDDDVCQQLFHPIRMTGDHRPSVLRSVFATEDGLRTGLHQVYIRYPENTDRPLVFSNEQAGGDWWNQEIRPSSLTRLQELQQEHDQIVEEQFYTKLSPMEIDGRRWYDQIFATIGRLFGAPSDEARSAQRSTTTESLNLSILNEFHHYRQALQHLLTQAEYEALEPNLIATSQCLVDLLDSLPEKKYREERQACDATLRSVTTVLEDRNERYSQINSFQDFLQLPEASLDQEQRRDRILIGIGQKINDLVDEIGEYNRMVHESFNFDLEQGDNL